jgi:Domain of unknown function (DUF6538)
MLHLDAPSNVPTRGLSRMALANYLRRRGATYSVRVPVPKDLQTVVGKTEIVKALGGVRDPAEARRKGPAAAQEIHDWFDQLRSSPLLRFATRVGAEVQQVEIAMPALPAAANRKRQEAVGAEWDLEEAAPASLQPTSMAPRTLPGHRKPRPSTDPPWTCSSAGRRLEWP